MKVRISKSDVLFSLLIRERADYRCQRCGKPYERNDARALHCSHLIGRRNKAVRWHPLNAVAHDFFCHKYLTENPIEFHAWIKAHLTPAQFAELTITAMKPTKLDSAFKKHIERNLQSELDRVRALRAQGVTGPIDFASPYDGEVQPLPRKARKPRKAKPKAAKRKLQSRPFPKAHRPLRRKYPEAA